MIKKNKSKKKDNFGKIYVPNSIDLSGLSKTEAKNLILLVSQIYFWRVFHNYHKETFINLHQDLLAKVIDVNKIKVTKQIALERKFIETDNHYIVGEKSTGYRLGPALRDEKFHLAELPGGIFKKKVVRFRKHITNVEQLSKDKVAQHLIKWLYQIEFTNDVDEIIDQIHISNPKADPEHQKEIIEDNLIHASICSYGRFHSNITHIPSKLRNCLQIDNQKLIEIDIVSSQPCILGIVLFQDFHFKKQDYCLKDQFLHSEESLRSFQKIDHNLQISNKKKLIEKKFSKLNDQKENSNNNTNKNFPYFPLSPSLMNQFFLENQHNSALDNDLQQHDFDGFFESQELTGLENFIFQTLNGSLYEILQSDNNFETREIAKTTFFEAVYSGNKERLKILDNSFPEVKNQILAIKKRKGYKWLAQEMQRLESKIIIRSACHDIMNHDHKIPLVTVHDSIATTENYVDFVKESILKAFRQFSPFVPKLRIK